MLQLGVQPLARLLTANTEVSDVVPELMLMGGTEAAGDPSPQHQPIDLALKLSRECQSLCLAKTPSSPEIKSLHNFLNSPICYDCSLCSAFSASGWEQSSGFFDHGRTCSWRTSHFVSSSVYSSVETGGPNWPPSISSSGSWPAASGPAGKNRCL